jgi:hypothetical protein
MIQNSGGKIDSREQLTHAIEFSIMGWYHLIHKPSDNRSVPDLLHLMNFLWNLQKNPDMDLRNLTEKRVSDTSMKNYRARLKDEFRFFVDFQGGYADYQEDLQREKKIKRLVPLISWYLHYVLPSHSDDSLLLLLKNISEKNSENKTVPADPLLAFYYLIAFQHAARCGIPVDIVYREIMGGSETSRRVTPLAAIWRAPYMNLIAKDKKDGKIKQFVLSSVISLTSDLWKDFFKVLTGEPVERETFDYESYKNDPEYSFLRTVKKYTFRMNGHTFYHFRHSWNTEWQLIEEKSATEHIVSITSDDWRKMMLLLFDYGSFIELINEETIQEGEVYGPDSIHSDCSSEKLPLLCAYRKRLGEYASG